MIKIIKGDTLKNPENIFTLIMIKCRLALAIDVKNVLNSYLLADKKGYKFHSLY